MRRKIFPGCRLFVIVLSGLFFSASSSPEEIYRDGTYFGMARDNRYRIMVKLNVIVDGGRIKEIEFIEVPDWGRTEVIKGEMRRRILEKQSPRVDSLSGPTLSCDLIKLAVEDALSHARAQPSSSPPLASSPGGTNQYPEVILQTNRGKIELRLFPDKAPLASENFLTLVKRGYYDGTIFHRVIVNFMIQGGDPSGSGRGGESAWGKPFPDEFSPELKFDRVGLLAMANHGPDTNVSQFFITVARTPWLGNRHTIFGEVISGFEVVEAISRVPVQPGSHRPLEEQKIIKASVK
jgi:peptidylprolyl isomerase